MWKVHFQSVFTEKNDLSWEFVLWSWDPAWTSISPQGFDTDEWTAGRWIHENSLNLCFWLMVEEEAHFALPVTGQKKLATRHYSSKTLLAVWAITQDLGGRIREEILPRNPKNWKLKIFFVSLEDLHSNYFHTVALKSECVEIILLKIFADFKKLTSWTLSFGPFSPRC